jgi:hypothetical protein
MNSLMPVMFTPALARSVLRLWIPVACVQRKAPALLSMPTTTAPFPLTSAATLD